MSNPIKETFSTAWLSNPEIFSVGEMLPFSDHEIFASVAEADEGKSSLVRCLNGAWRAHFAINPAGAPESLLTDASGDAELMEINVPCEFQIVNPEWDPPHYVNTQYPWDGLEDLKAPEVSDKYNPTVTAIRTFELSAEDLQHQLVLTFGGVEAAVALYVNGAFVGYAEDTFTPHHFDISAYAKEGENRLCARIFKRCTGSWLEDQDFWRFSGIHRAVTLTLRPKTHLKDLRVKTPLTENYTKAHLNVTMQLEGELNGSAILCLTDKDGNVLLQEVAAAAEEVKLQREVPGVKLWSAEEPNLYILTISLADEKGQVAEVSRVKVGFRQYDMIDKVLCVNGKRVVFHGVNRHEFDCDLGRVMTRELLMQDMHDMKSLNVNAVRTCHYPNTSDFYRLCDEVGFYVICETNIESHGSWSPMHDWVVPGDKPEWHDMVIYRGSHMLERDKNHACIILWSCGNESWGGQNLQDLHDYFRANDDTRLVHYEGCVHDPRFPDMTDIHSNMYAKVADIERYLNSNPTKPFINCEYTHAMGNSCGGMHLYRELEDKYPMYQGGFIWDYVDQALRVKAPNGETRLAYGGDFGDKPTDWQFNTNGIILGDRTFTPKCQEVRYVFRDVFMTPDKTGVLVWNRKMFAALKNYNVRWTVECDRVPVKAGEQILPEIAAGEKLHVELPFGELPENGQIVITCFLVLREDQGVLKAGEVLSQGQTVYGETVKAPAAVTAGKPVLGDNNVGFITDNMSVLFEYARSMISFRDQAGRETLLRSPQLSMFRAPTDNDNGNRDAIRQGVWHMVSRYSYHKGAQVKTENGVTTVTYTYMNAMLPGLKLPVIFTWREDGAVDVTMRWPGVENQPDLPAFGLSFQLDPRLTHVKYWGMGPDENYCDRREGAYLGWHAYEVKENFTRYEKPQECGSREGVEVLTVTGDDGHGVEISGHDLSVSVLPYLPEEMAQAYHHEELQGSCRTILDVAMFRKGVGGDDSWGAPVLPQYRYPSEKEYEFTFTIRSI